MDNNFQFYRCWLEGRQLRIGETGLWRDTEVVRTICDADFPKNNLNLNAPNTKTNYTYEYVKPPKDGLYLIRVKKASDQTGLRVLIDTRLSPCFIWIEKIEDMEHVKAEVASVLNFAINEAANKYGWHAKIIEFKSGEMRDMGLFLTAYAYINDVPDFKTFILYEERTDEIMKMLHLKIDNKGKAQLIMPAIRAAIDTGLITKPDYDSFAIEFLKDGIVSLSSYKNYTKESINPLENDPAYKEYVKQFLILKEKWLNEIRTI